MASGQQVAEENVRLFTTWAASRTDEDFRNMVTRGVLSRTEIAAECGFAKSALVQNPRIREALKNLEAALRNRGVLPQLASEGEPETSAPRLRAAESPRVAQEAERVSRLEHENASLKAENAELKRLFGRFAVLQEVLSETGRLPR